MRFCGLMKKKGEKSLIPATFCGQFRCALPDNGDSFTMYPLGIAEWQNHPVSVFKHRRGHYIIRGDIVAVEAVLLDQRPLSRQIWAKYRLGKVVDFLVKVFGEE